jgi:hypothetical protein
MKCRIVLRFRLSSPRDSRDPELPFSIMASIAC